MRPFVPGEEVTRRALAAHEFLERCRDAVEQGPEEVSA